MLTASSKPAGDADASITLAKATLDQIQLSRLTMDQAISAGDIKIAGKRESFSDFLALLDTYPFWFHIVTP